MTLEALENYHKQAREQDLTFYAELFCDDIWCGLGEDCATVSICALKQDWQLHYIRTQNGIPCITSEYTSEVVDEYTKTLPHDALYDFINLHALGDAFETFMTMQKKKEM